MKKKISDILYNPSSLSSVTSDAKQIHTDADLMADLRQFYLFLVHATHEHLFSVTMYHKCCERLKVFVKLLNDRQGVIPESLWVQVEKCAYVLSLWERDGIFKNISRFH